MEHSWQPIWLKKLVALRCGGQLHLHLGAIEPIDTIEVRDTAQAYEALEAPDG